MQHNKLDTVLTLIQKHGESRQQKEKELGEKIKKIEHKENKEENNFDLKDLVSAKLLCKPYIKKGTTSVIHVLFELTTKKLPSSTTSPFNLALVLDRSGSMSGNPLENSKAAIIQIIRKLSSKDLLHLIAYDSSAETVFRDGTSLRRTELELLAEGVRDQGCTNLTSGLMEGYLALTGDNNNNNNNNLDHGIPRKRIFIFSDGQVNEGIKDKKDIYKIVKNMHDYGINVSSFGLGSSFDEELMKGIAEYGHGDYFFIDGAADIDYKVKKGMEVLTELIATNSRLKLKLPSGIEVVKVHGFNATDDVAIGDLCADDVRQVLLELKVAPQNFSGEIDLVNWNLEFDSLQGKKESMDGKLSIKVTFNENDVEIEIPEIVVAKEIKIAGETDLKIKDLISKGDYDSAITLKKESINRLNKAKSLDKTGLVDLILQRAQAVLEGLQSKKDKALLEKDVGYSSHQCNIVHRKCF